MSIPTIVEFVTDSQLLALSIGPAQETILRGRYGLPLVDDEQRALWATVTGGRTYRDGHRFTEMTVLAGARSGKDSRIAAPIACYEAIFGGYDAQLSKGERGMVVIVAQDERATRIAFGYVRDYLLGSPVLANFVADERKKEIVLTNGLSICCFPCTVSALRGWSIPCGILDELAFWRLEGAVDSDAEVQTSIRRGGLNFPATSLIKISTPYLKSGVLYDDVKASYGQDDPDRLVIKATSALMNPTLTPERLAKEKRLDPVRFAREYEAEWTDALTVFLASDWVESAIDRGVHERTPQDNLRYVAACDASGGGEDSFTYCVAHREPDGTIVQDLLKGHRRASLEATVAQIAATLACYRVRSIEGDRYAANWVVEAFQRAGVRYEPSKDPSGKALDQSAAYEACEPLFATGKVRLLDHPKQREWSLLERTARPGGASHITHPRGSHDDYAASAARAFARLAPQAVTVRVRRITY
jgi:hypothetical protein